MDPYSMGGWGKGLQGAGDALAQLASFYESRRRDKATRDEQAAAAKTAAEERARRQAEADRLYNQNLELKKFELGLEEAEPLERRLRGASPHDQALTIGPGGAGPALAPRVGGWAVNVHGHGW